MAPAALALAIGGKVRWCKKWLLVGDLDWCQSGPKKCFTFYTTPPVVVYLPDETGVAYSQTCFHRLQVVLAEGGFWTYDLG